MLAEQREDAVRKRAERPEIAEAVDRLDAAPLGVVEGGGEGEVVAVGVEVVAGAVGLVGVVRVEVELVLAVEVVVEAVAQSWAASAPTVLAPWLRSARSVPLRVAGRFDTSLLSVLAALAAAPQLRAPTAEETLPRSLSRLLAWLPESRPAPPPQATRRETARPRPPARRARGA